VGIIHLVRHGQASFGAVDYDVLSPEGEEQARLLGLALAGLRPDRVVHGSLVRQRRTASIAAAAAGWRAVPTVDHRWDELAAVPLTVGSGSLEDAQRAYEAGLERWICGETGDEESFVDFVARAEAALADLGDGTCVVVTSGGPIAAVAAGLLSGAPAVFPRLMRVLANASVTKVVSGRRGLSLLTFNEHAHLLPDRVTYR